MSYTPTNWQTGDIITAAKLNNMEQGLTPLIVNLTPLYDDFSGEMDKTRAELYAAYQAGQRIIYRVWMGEGEYIEADVTMVYTNTNYTYPSFNAFIIDAGNHLLIEAAAPTTNDGTEYYYSTTIYPLTPM